MPGPSDLIENFGDEFGEDSFGDADEFADGVRRMAGRLKSRLPPSERDRMDMSVKVDDDIDADGDKRLLMETYDLLDVQDRFEFEKFVQRGGVEPVNSSWEWANDNQNLVYFVMYHVSDEVYRERRQKQIRPDTAPGPMERAGRKIDVFFAWLMSFFVHAGTK
jgi:hypothetical protein